MTDASFPRRRDEDANPEIMEAKFEAIANRAAKAALADLFEIFGHDITKPEGRKGAQKDFAWLSDARRGSERIRGIGVKAFWTTVFTALTVALWKGLKAMGVVIGGP